MQIIAKLHIVQEVGNVKNRKGVNEKYKLAIYPINNSGFFVCMNVFFSFFVCSGVQAKLICKIISSESLRGNVYRLVITIV